MTNTETSCKSGGVCFLISIFIFFAISLNTYAHECKVNGCGSGIFDVPDKLKLVSVDFQASCNKHDKCYSRCIGSCNINKIFQPCSIEETKTLKKECDATFLNDMKTACKKAGKDDLSLCYVTANSYHSAVTVSGSLFIKGERNQPLLSMVIDKGIEKPKQIFKNVSRHLSNKNDDDMLLQFIFLGADSKDVEYIDWFGMDETSTKNTKND